MDIGERFPHFSLLDENGEVFDSSSLENLRYVLYFYSKDGTAGCTREAVEFSSVYPKLMLRNIIIIGVSRDLPSSHRKFIDKNSLKLKLLSDPDHILMEDAGVWGTKMMYGKEILGTKRSTFIVGKDGKIEAAWKNVKVAGHADTVSEKAISLSRSP